MVIKSSLYCITLICALLLSFSSPTQANFQKTKIAVLDFELRGDSFKTAGMGGIVAEWFTTTLVKDGRFEVVERALLQKIIAEQKLGMTGLINESSSTQIGQILGVKIIITGSVLRIEKKIEVNARIINVETGSIIAAENVQSEEGDNLQTVIASLTARIVKNFPLTGYIVKRRDKSVLIDLGAASGLQWGMEFLVFREGEVIKHPKTGEVLDIEQISTGKIKITKIRPNIATAEIISEEEGQKILYGQLVQSIRKPSISKKTQQQSTVKPRKAAEKIMPPEVKKIPESYIRQEFPAGERDNLSSGGQAPPMLPLTTGSFMMGGHRFSEKPKHYVTIDQSVFLMTSEVTFEDYNKFCLDTGHPIPNDFSWGHGEQPVINVSWHDAQAYAKWLTVQTGIGYRLPFETEWEWAAKAGSDDLYPWGNSFKKSQANCKNCGSKWNNKQTAPVRSFPPNSFGFHDLSGNVWEWVQDCWVENYVNAPKGQSEREYTGKCGNYTIRGGAWNSPVRQVSTSSRLGVWANTKSNYIGFRLVKDLDADLPSSSPLKSLPPTIAEDDEAWDSPSEPHQQTSIPDWPEDGK